MHFMFRNIGYLRLFVFFIFNTTLLLYSTAKNISMKLLKFERDLYFITAVALQVGKPS